MIGPILATIGGAVLFASLCTVLAKVGQPWWAALVPVYVFIVTCRAAGRPGWWVLLLAIPIVGLVFWVIVVRGLVGRFGHEWPMTVLMVTPPFIGWPLLAVSGRPEPRAA